MKQRALHSCGLNPDRNHNLWMENSLEHIQISIHVDGKYQDMDTQKSAA